MCGTSGESIIGSGKVYQSTGKDKIPERKSLDTNREMASAIAGCEVVGEAEVVLDVEGHVGSLPPS